MNKRLWIFQYAKDIRTKGAAKASWYVGWYDQDGSGTLKAAVRDLGERARPRNVCGNFSPS